MRPVTDHLPLLDDGEPDQPDVPPESLLKLSPRQLDLLAAAVDIEERDASKVGMIGFSARLWAQMALPYRDPGCVGEWSRRNGDLTLFVEPGRVEQPDRTFTRAFPFGIIPRLLMVWMATEATRTQDRELALGPNLAGFMRDLGLGNNGRTIARLRDQIQRVATARLWVTDQRTEVTHSEGFQIANSMSLWWTTRDGPDEMLWPSTITLSQEFYQSIVSAPIPIDLRALGALRAKGGGGLAIDIYTWLAHRMSYLRGSTRIPWPMLELQFGSQYARPRAFKEKFLEQLAAVKVVYPEAKVRPYEHVLLLSPSPTPISAAQTRWRKTGSG